MDLSKVKECTKINNSNKSICFTYNKLNDESILTGVYSKNHNQIFFLLFNEAKNKICVYLLNNYDSERILFYKNENPENVRKELIKLLAEMYPLKKSNRSKDHCYPRPKE